MSSSTVFEKLEHDIEKHGWHVLSVLRKESPSFSYTIGFQETLKHPEILMSGLRTELMHKLLNNIGNLIKKGYTFNDGDTCNEVIKGYPVKFLSVSSHQVEEYFRAAVVHYGRDNFQALQCIWPDKDGNFQLETDVNQDILA